MVSFKGGNGDSSDPVSDGGGLSGGVSGVVSLHKKGTETSGSLERTYMDVVVGVAWMSVSIEGSGADGEVLLRRVPTDL